MKNAMVAKRRAAGGLPPAARAGMLLIVLALLLVPTAVSAVEIEGSSSTYLLSRETADGSKLLPLYEYLNFNVQDVGRESLSFYFGGAVRYDLGDHAGEREKNSDLQYAYLHYRNRSSNAVVDLGRIMVFEGVAAERVDGVYARTDLQAGFGISAFGGAPVMTNEGNDSGTNTVYGARASHKKDGLYTVGLSYLTQKKNSEDFRKEEGLDLWVRPTDGFEVMGKSAYNAASGHSGWMQHAYNVVLGPYGKLKVNAEVSRTDYEYYFDATTNTAFTFTPGGAIDPKEKLDLVGVGAAYAFSDAVKGSVDVKQYSYDIAGSASYVGATVRYAPSREMTAGGSIHRMSGDTDRLSYYEYRVFGKKKYGQYDVTVDLMNVAYDEAINGVSSAFSAAIAAGYELNDKMMLGADVEYAKNPDYDKDVRAFLKLIYKFQATVGKGKGV